MFHLTIHGFSPKGSRFVSDSAIGFFSIEELFMVYTRTHRISMSFVPMLPYIFFGGGPWIFLAQGKKIFQFCLFCHYGTLDCKCKSLVKVEVNPRKKNMYFAITIAMISIVSRAPNFILFLASLQ